MRRSGGGRMSGRRGELGEVWAGRDQGAHGHGPRKYFGATAPGEFKSTARDLRPLGPNPQKTPAGLVQLDEDRNRWYYTK
jgi:hypothetical protein